jgi:hypothetical protein
LGAATPRLGLFSTTDDDGAMSSLSSGRAPDHRNPLCSASLEHVWPLAQRASVVTTGRT